MSDKPGQTLQNLKSLLGIDLGISQQVLSCENCQRLKKLIDIYEQQSSRHRTSQQKMRKIFKKLEKHNSEVVADTDIIAKDFQVIVMQLENELHLRDEFISKLQDQVQSGCNFIQEKQTQYETTIQLLNSKISSLVNDHRIRIADKETQNYKLREGIKAKLGQYQIQILKLVNQKRQLQHRIVEVQGKMELQSAQHRQETAVLKSQIQRNEQLVKFMSNCNNQIRLEMVELRSKVEISQITEATERKRIVRNESAEQMDKIRKQNLELRAINGKLTRQLEILIEQFKVMDTLLNKVKNQRDMLQESIIKFGHLPRPIESSVIGKIRPNYPITLSKISTNAQ